MVGTMDPDLTVQVNPAGRAIYIYLRPIRAGGVARTEQVCDGVMADFGRRGELLGVELLGSKAVGRLFSRVGKESRFKALRPLASKKALLARLIA